MTRHDLHGRTHRLELDDQSLRDWDATVLASDPEQGLVLDRSAFYPGGGGQPPDHGVLLWGGVTTRIVGVRKGDDLWLVPHEDDPLPPVGTAVRGALDDDRRSTLMRTHSALHLLGGVVFRDYGSLVTGGNMEPGEARLDFNLPELPPGFKDAVAAACDAEVRADRAIAVCYRPTSRASASSTSTGSTCRPMAAPTWRRPLRSAASTWSRSRTRAKASAGCASGLRRPAEASPRQKP